MIHRLNTVSNEHGMKISTRQRHALKISKRKETVVWTMTEEKEPYNTHNKKETKEMDRAHA